MEHTNGLDSRRVALAVREACIRAALEGYERAALDGLCHEGAWECAIDAMRALDLDALLAILRQERPAR